MVAMLRGQDVLVALKLLSGEGGRWTYEALGSDLEMSTSGVHNAIHRAGICGLVDIGSRRAVRPALAEFLVHGIRYVFPAERGPRGRGVVTGPSASPLADHIASSGDSPIVWAYPHGDVRGDSIAPIYPTVPEAALADPELHALLALVDGIRLGGARLRSKAAELLAERLAR